MPIRSRTWRGLAAGGERERGLRHSRAMCPGLRQRRQTLSLVHMATTCSSLRQLKQGPVRSGGRSERMFMDGRGAGAGRRRRLRPAACQPSCLPGGGASSRTTMEGRRDARARGGEGSAKGGLDAGVGKVGWRGEGTEAPETRRASHSAAPRNRSAHSRGPRPPMRTDIPNAQG